MHKQILLVLLFCGVFVFANAQHSEYKSGMKVPCPVCKASGRVEKARIPPPQDFLLKSGEAKSNITVEYKGFSEEPKAAFAYAVEIWESIIESEVPIRMEAKWSVLGTNVLGSCGPETFYSNFKDAPVKDRYYAVATAEKIAGEELNGESRYDMNANFNKKIDWYYGTDMNCPDSLYDFVSVVLHEIGHGLGFFNFFYVQDDLGAYGYGAYGSGSATPFDELVQTLTRKELLDTSFYENFSTELKKALTSNSLYSNSPVAKKNNNNIRPKLYAPGTFDDGSSIAHLNDLTYPHGNPNSLMTHAVGRGEAIHDPGPITRGILDDIGWRNLFIRHNPVKDKEEVAPISFNVELESDYEVDTSALWIIYSNDGFQEHSDSVVLKYAAGSGDYAALLTPESGTTEISYFVEAADTMNRVRTLPSNIPQEYYNVKFQPDNEAPVISHEAIPYFLKLDEPLTIKVNADDNLGIDTVYVSFSINEGEEFTFGLNKSGIGLYSGTFPVDIEDLNDGDKIEYTIFSQDKALAGNTAQLPENDQPFSFKVEAIFDPVISYTNNFDDLGSDFLLSDFEVYKADGFDNMALHSPHPYASGGDDNTDLEFWTFLKYPVILKESGTMTFDEVVLVEPGELTAYYGSSDFWDYVVIEGSKDYGNTWLDLAIGYDAGSQEIWKEQYNEVIIDQVSLAKGNAELFYNREIDLLKNGNFAAGDTVLIRFLLYSDPYANGWGWAIDNLQIQQAVSAEVISESSDVKIFPNPFNSSLKISIRSVENNSEIKVDIFDMFGKKVYGKQLGNVFGELNETIQLNELRSGIYLIHITENGKTIRSKKLIKN